MQYCKRATMRRRRGFTLLETALTTTIIGVAVVAVVQLLATGNRASGETMRLTTGMHLAADVREFTLNMTPVELDSLNGNSFTPPIDARGQDIANMTGWTQTIAVSGADVQRLSFSVPVASTPLRQVSVTVSKDGDNVFNTKWLSAD